LFDIFVDVAIARERERKMDHSFIVKKAQTFIDEEAE
jgi:hypothetical protein